MKQCFQGCIDLGLSVKTDELIFFTIITALKNALYNSSVLFVLVNGVDIGIPE